MNAIKILQVCHSFYPCIESGGVVKVAYDLSKGLVNKGHQVTVYTTDGCSKRLKVKKNSSTSVDGITTYYFRNLSNFLRVNLKLATPYHLLLNPDGFKDFDVIHIHEHRTILAVIAYYYAKKHGIPYVLQAHGSALPISQKVKLKELFDKIIGFNILKDADKLIALTKTEFNGYVQLGLDKNKIEILPNGVYPSDFEHLPNPGSFKKLYSIDENEKMILYIGRLHRNKGIDLLVKAFSDISKELKNCRLVIAGPDAGYRSTLEDLAKSFDLSDVLFTGAISNENKIRAFVDADVFITPSFSGFPITFLEACACGTPIVTTKFGDDLDWIDGNVGYVVDYDKTSLKNAALMILKNQNLRVSLGNNGKKLVNENFAWEKIIRRIEEIYNESTTAKAATEKSAAEKDTRFLNTKHPKMKKAS